jgi:hypothetical protein
MPFIPALKGGAFWHVLVKVRESPGKRSHQMHVLFSNGHNLWLSLFAVRDIYLAQIQINVLLFDIHNWGNTKCNEYCPLRKSAAGATASLPRILNERTDSRSLFRAFLTAFPIDYFGKMVFNDFK